MIRLLRWLIWGDGHAHHWKIIREGKVWASETDTLAVGNYYNLQCEHCGNIKVKKT
jgi:hypothetical protein